MRRSPGGHDSESFEATRQAREQQWSRSAFAIGLLFASLPVACRVFLGSWGFDGSFQVAALFLVAGIYLHLRSRRRVPTAPDDATLLDRAISLASQGDTDRGILLLTKAIRLNPRLWQAFQYRGELRLLQPDQVMQALDDFNEAIRLAPNEPYLYVLRAHTYRALGDEAAAQADESAAAV